MQHPRSSGATTIMLAASPFACQFGTTQNFGFYQCHDLLFHFLTFARQLTETGKKQARGVQADPILFKALYEIDGCKKPEVCITSPLTRQAAAPLAGFSEYTGPVLMYLLHSDAWKPQLLGSKGLEFPMWPASISKSAPISLATLVCQSPS